MRILILTNLDVGLYQFRRELIRELLKKNEVTLALPYGPLVEPLKRMGCRFADIPLERRGMNPAKDAKLFLAYRRLLRTMRPELVITYTVKPNIYGGLAAQMAKIPYAVNITGLGTAFRQDGMLKRLVTAMYRRSCAQAGTVFFENSENRQTFLDAGIISRGQACLLPGAGVNLQHYTAAAYPGGDVTRFLFIGRVMREKGIDELLAAMRMLREDGIPCFLDVLGGLEEDYSGVLSRCGQEGWLKYWGCRQDVRPFIAASHCLVLPSWHEGMANTVLECAASGRPVIASRIPGCMEGVEDGVTGFLCRKQDPSDLYRVMKEFSQIPRDRREAMGLAGRRRMEALFDRTRVVSDTIANLKMPDGEKVGV